MPRLCMFKYTTHTFITEAIYLVTQVQLLLMTVTVKINDLKFNTPTPMHTIPTIKTEAFRLVACVKLFKRNVKVKLMAFAVISYSY